MTNCHYPRLLLLAAASALLAQCASTTEVVPVSQVKADNKGGIVYTLPRTALIVAVPVIMTEREVGVYWKYAEALFGSPPVIKEDKVGFKIGDCTITPVGVPDRTKVFYAQISGGPFTDASLSLQMDAQGLLNAAAAEAENKTVDFVIAALEGAAKIAGSAALASQGMTAVDPITTLSPPPDPIILARIRVAYNRAVSANLTYQSVIAGQGNTSDLPTFEARLKEAKELLAKAMAPFYGTQSTTTWTLQYKVEPEKSGTIALFNYSDHGVTLIKLPFNRSVAELLAAEIKTKRLAAQKKALDAVTAAQAEQEKATTDDQKKTAAENLAAAKAELEKIQTALAKATSKPSQQQQPAVVLTEGDKTKEVSVYISLHRVILPDLASTKLYTQTKRGIHYNLPAPGKVSVRETLAGTWNPKLLFSKEVAFGQFGSIAFLPTTTGSRKLRQEITLDPASGALLKVSNVSGAFDAALVNRGASATADLIKVGQ